jgi:hypothetical protein
MKNVRIIKFLVVILCVNTKVLYKDNKIIYKYYITIYTK